MLIPTISCSNKKKAIHFLCKTKGKVGVNGEGICFVILHKIFLDQWNNSFSRYWKIILKAAFPPLQRTEEKEMHLNYSEEASAIKCKIKYPALRDLACLLVETMTLSPWRNLKRIDIIAPCWGCLMKSDLEMCWLNFTICSPKNKTALICSICQFLQYNYSSHGRFQVATVMPVTMESGRDGHPWPVWGSILSWLQHSTGVGK